MFSFRLELYDRNSNFGRSLMELEYNMDLPTVDCYKDLNADADVPKFSSDNVAAYLATYDKTVDKISIDMYNDGYINYIRYASKDQLVFFKAECRAQMKAKISYIVDISLNDSGIVMACQCECGAGMGPSAHCKHTVAVLFGLTKFAGSGDFVTQQTCTQTLQTFHKAPKHTGTPLKVQNLQLTVNANIDYDPRPSQFVNHPTYESFFKNTVINSGLMNNAPISQILAPANTLAVVHDHCYIGSHDPFESFFESAKLIHMSESEAHELQCATIGQSDNLTWKSERLKRLNASTFGRICKLTERTNGSVYAKTLLKEKDLSCPAVNHGKANELLAVKKYEEISGRTTKECGMFVCTKLPFLSATPDRVIDESLILEVKCPFTARNDKITPKTVDYLELVSDELKLKMTHDYFYQVQGQMLCTGASHVDFVIYTFVDIKVLRISRADDFITDMVAKLQVFYDKYFRQALIENTFAKDYFDCIACHCSKQ